MNFKDMEKIAHSRTKARKLCSCGRSLLLGSQDKVICSWCGKYCFKDKETEFKYRLMENIKKAEREIKNENINK